jgi:hypothetical protein
MVFFVNIANGPLLYLLYVAIFIFRFLTAIYRILKISKGIIEFSYSIISNFIILSSNYELNQLVTFVKSNLFETIKILHLGNKIPKLYRVGKSHHVPKKVYHKNKKLYSLKEIILDKLVERDNFPHIMSSCQIIQDIIRQKISKKKNSYKYSLPNYTLVFKKSEGKYHYIKFVPKSISFPKVDNTHFVEKKMIESYNNKAIMDKSIFGYARKKYPNLFDDKIKFIYIDILDKSYSVVITICYGYNYANTNIPATYFEISKQIFMF